MKLIPTKKQWKKWTLPTKLSVIGTLIGLLSFGTYSIEKAISLGTAIENPPSKDFLYGKWEANEIEKGMEIKIIWHLKEDGTSTYSFKIPSAIPNELKKKYKFVKQAKTEWYYNDGIIYEKSFDISYLENKYNNQKEYDQARSLIKAIDKNTFELTIVDNDDLESRGDKRTYTRILTKE